ncbi:hypothetical protein LTR15_000025 [Elasticomyces elasticus]|nr:hypothetical protein LTR15_000025 [Elasticomyces elasticus]
MYYMSFLDKTEPSMSHTGCEKLRCKAIARDRQCHWEDKCSCEQVEVDQGRVMSVLNAGSAIPLLHFTEQEHPSCTYQEADTDSREVSQISIKVVASTDATPYVAISHIWSDGLGNANANSLNACKLRKLRQMVQALPPLVTPADAAKTADMAAVSLAEDCPLIWLDTLCCPVDPDDKKLALTRMRQVYEKASRVLVLDASIQSYSTTSMEPLEILSRIFTSRWLRRVWTLQEGALAKDLWFQFADKALSLVELKASMESVWRDDLHQKIVFFDIRKEIARIEQFFQHSGDDGRGSTLETLDEALLYRGITDPSDEPLCIGTLMNLAVESLLSPGKDIMEALAPGNNLQAEARLSLQRQLRDQRMQVVWKLLAEKFGCLPAQIIFFEEARLKAEGFRWAPQSLLDVQQVYLDPALRRLRWNDQNPGTPTENGLKVRYPGYRLYLQQYDDGKPRHPWPGRKRVPENQMVFRDAQTQEWYIITTKQRVRTIRDEPGIVLTEFPLHDFVHQYGNTMASPHQGTQLDSAFLLLDETDWLNTPHPRKTAIEGLLMTGTYQMTDQEDASNIRHPPAGSKTILGNTAHHVMVAPLHAAQSSVYNAAEKSALQLRNEECTDKLLLAHAALDARAGHHSSESEIEEAYKSALGVVVERMKELMQEAQREDVELGPALSKLLCEDIKDYLWIWVGDWFHHAIFGEKIGGGDGVWWIVD